MKNNPPIREDMVTEAKLLSKVWIKYFTKNIGIDDLINLILGTDNQIIIVDNGDGTIKISLPQDIDTEADVEFGSLVVDTITTDSLKLKIQRSSANTTIDNTAYQWNGDTSTIAFTYTLPIGAQNETYKVVNVGGSGNLLTVIPNGSELLLGESSSFVLEDKESLILAYDIIDGWY